MFYKMGTQKYMCEQLKKNLGKNSDDDSLAIAQNRIFVYDRRKMIGPGRGIDETQRRTQPSRRLYVSTYARDVEIIFWITKR